VSSLCFVAGKGRGTEYTAPPPRWGRGASEAGKADGRPERTGGQTNGRERRRSGRAPNKKNRVSRPGPQWLGGVAAEPQGPGTDVKRTLTQQAETFTSAELSEDDLTDAALDMTIAWKAVRTVWTVVVRNIPMMLHG